MAFKGSWVRAPSSPPQRLMRRFFITFLKLDNISIPFKGNTFMHLLTESKDSSIQINIKIIYERGVKDEG